MEYLRQNVYLVSVTSAFGQKKKKEFSKDTEKTHQLFCSQLTLCKLYKKIKALFGFCLGNEHFISVCAIGPLEGLRASRGHERLISIHFLRSRRCQNDVTFKLPAIPRLSPRYRLNSLIEITVGIPTFWAKAHHSVRKSVENSHIFKCASEAS